MRPLVPYPTLFGDIEFRVVGAALDGRGLPLHRISRSERTVALLGEHDRWDEAGIELRADLPERELAEGPWTDVVCVAVLTESVTNTRTVSRLRRTPNGSWQGTVVLDRGSVRSRATLGVSVVATVAGEAGKLIGEAEDTWVIDLDAPQPARRRELRIVEVDFRDGLPWLRPYKEAPWLVDTSGESPTVHVNTGFEGLGDFLSSGGNPVEKAVRDLLAAQIATEAWTAMTHSALAGLETDEDGTPQWPTGWKDWALRAVLPDIVPDLSLTDALTEVHRRRTDGEGWSEMQSRIQYAAGRRARVGKNIGTALRSLHGLGGSEY